MVNLTPWILVPAYIYPSQNAWNTLYSSISANPNLQFRVIVNPASGPGAANSYPDSNYIAAISKLRTYKNTQLLGYVDTAYATRSYSDAVQDVKTYVNWKSYGAANLAMDGIFFDDNPNSDVTNDLTYLANITRFTKSQMKNAHVCLNPGTYVSDKWYAIADSIVAYEDTFSAFSTSSINNVKSTQRAKSIFVVHSYTGSNSNQQKLVSQLYNAGIAGHYITNKSGYNSWSTYWANFAQYVAAVSASANTKSNGVVANKVAVKGAKVKRDTHVNVASTVTTTKSTSTVGHKSSSTKATSKPTVAGPKPTPGKQSKTGTTSHALPTSNPKHSGAKNQGPPKKPTGKSTTAKPTSKPTPTTSHHSTSHTSTAKSTTSSHAAQRLHPRSFAADDVAVIAAF